MKLFLEQFRELSMVELLAINGGYGSIGGSSSGSYSSSGGRSGVSSSYSSTTSTASSSVPAHYSSTTGWEPGWGPNGYVGLPDSSNDSTKGVAVLVDYPENNDQFNQNLPEISGYQKIDTETESTEVYQTISKILNIKDSRTYQSYFQSRVENAYANGGICVTSENITGSQVSVTTSLYNSQYGLGTSFRITTSGGDHTFYDVNSDGYIDYVK